MPFVGRFRVSDSEKEVASDIRRVVDVEGARARAPNWDAIIRELTRNAESIGIMVMRSGVVDGTGAGVFLLQSQVRRKDLPVRGRRDDAVPERFVLRQDFEASPRWQGQGAGDESDRIGVAVASTRALTAWFFRNQSLERLIMAPRFTSHMLMLAYLRFRMIFLSACEQVSPRDL